MTATRNKFAKRILVTGGAGFIGSNYLNWAVRKYPKYFFINVDALTYAGRIKNVQVESESNYTFEKADIRDLKTMERIFKKYRPTHIIHFAAESHVDVSISNPDIFIETNVIGTHNLLILAKKYQLKRFHHISTDEVYGSLAPHARSSKEDDGLFPNSPYSASKASAEMLVRAYNKTFGLDTVITRSSNNYGPFQYEEKIIPLFITHLLANKKVPLYGNGRNIRNWIYVEDNVEGINSAFHKGKSGEIYNLGGTTELSNIKLTTILLRALHKASRMITYVTDRPGHDVRYSLDSSKAKKQLGWKPRTSFAEGLKKTIEFYRGS
ncbi:MAG: dTDP-glucose 4,6-dehydratase [Parcubacteria group bacterium Gr01-1014_8]|nr:MAG: dTDP-glucose 4,6-dehydratase [Parcubacteria group bacterium Gr01-1014_8]